MRITETQNITQIVDETQKKLIESEDDAKETDPTTAGLIPKEVVAKIAGIVLQDPYEVSFLTRVRSIAASKTAAWIRSRKNAGL